MRSSTEGGLATIPFLLRKSSYLMRQKTYGITIFFSSEFVVL